MSVTLDNLIIEFSADFAGFDAELNKATNKAVDAAKKIESIEISPSVDFKQLHELNKLLDVKQKHLKQTIDYFKKNSIKASFEIEDGDDLAEGSMTRSSSKKDDNMDVIDSTDAKAATQVTVVDSNAKGIRGTKEFNEDSAKIAEFITSPIKKFFTGFLEGAGQDLAKKVTKSFYSGIEKSLDISVEDFGDELAYGVSQYAKHLNKLFDWGVKGTATEKAAKRKAEQAAKKEPVSDEEQIKEKARRQQAKKKGYVEPEQTPLLVPFNPKLNQETLLIQKSVSHAQSALRTVDKAVGQLGAVATGITKSLPGGKTAITAAKVAAPFAIAGAAEAFIPGASQIIHGIQAGVGTAGSALANGLSANILGHLLPIIEAGTNALPIGGAAVNAAISGSLTTGVTSGVGGVIGAGSAIAGTGIAGKGISDTAGFVKDKLIGKQQSETKQIDAGNQKLSVAAAKSTDEALAFAATMVANLKNTAKALNISSNEMVKAKKLIAKADSGKALKPAEVNQVALAINNHRLAAQKVLAAQEGFEAAIKSQSTQMQDGSKGFGGAFASVKGQMAQVFNKAKSAKNFTDRFAVNPKTEFDKAIYGAITVDAKVIGKETSVGIEKGLDVDQFDSLGKKMGRGLAKGTKKALGIESPSKVYKLIGKDIVLGLKLGLVGIDTLLALEKDKIDKIVALHGNNGVNGKPPRKPPKTAVGASPDDSKPEDSNNSLEAARNSLEVFKRKPQRHYYRQQISDVKNRMHDRDVIIARELDFKTKNDAIRREKAKQKFYEEEQAKLQAERLQQISPASAIKNPAQFVRRILKSTASDRKLQVLGERLAEQGSMEYLDGMVRSAKRKVRSKMPSDMPRKEKDQLIGEASGMVLSAATMYNPILPLGAALAPIAVPLMPVIAAGFGVSRLLAPIIQQITTSLTETEPVTKRFEGISGKEQGTKDIEYAKSIAKEYSISTQVALENYAKLKVAANRTKLEGEGVQELFKGISVASKAMRLTTYDSDLIFQAFVQMLSKGKISMEELRQQLGERFPPAMNVFANALGVTTPQLDKMSRSGELLSEDVLPKVALVLKRDFGDAAKSASGDFLSAVTSMENAIFDLRSGLADQFGGLFAGLTNSSAKMVKIFGDNLGTISKVVGAALIGVTAQVAVGLQVILSAPAIANKMKGLSNILLTSFKTGFGLLSPFFFGVFVDIADDLLGAQHSIFHNMAQGVSNVFINAFAGLDNLMRNAGGGLFGATKAEGSNPFQFAIDGLKMLKKLIPPGLVEMGALVIMFEQVSLLGKLLLKPMFDGLGIALANYARTMHTALLTSKSWSSYMQVMFANSNLAAAGMKGLSIATGFAVAALVLAFARGDFSDPLISGIQKAQRSIEVSIEDIRNALTSLKPDIDQTAEDLGNLLPNKGLELNPKTILGISSSPKDSYKSDDLAEDFNAFAEKHKVLGAIGKALHNYSILGGVKRIGLSTRLKESDRTIERGEKLGLSEEIGLPSKGRGFVKLSQSQVINQAEDLQAGFTQNKQSLDILKLTPQTRYGKNGFMDQAKVDAIKDIQEIDAKIGELGAKKFKLTLEGTPEAKAGVVAIREEVRGLFKERENKVIPFKDIVSSLDSIRAKLKTNEEEIANSPYSAQIKRRLRESLSQQQELIDDAANYLEEQGFNKLLEPLSDSWGDVTKNLNAAETAFDNVKTKSNLKFSLAKADVYAGAEDNIEIKTRLDDLNLSELTNTTDNLSRLVTARSLALEKLLSIPQVDENPEREKEIESLRKELTTSEQELADSKLNLAKTRREIAEYRQVQQINNKLSTSLTPIAALQGNEVKSNIKAKIALELLKATGGLSDSAVSSKTAALSLKSSVSQLDITKQRLSGINSAISTTFSASSKAWFLQLIGKPASDFASALKSLTSEELATIRQYKSEDLASTPERAKLFDAAEQFVSTDKQALDQELATAEARSAIALAAKSAKENLENSFKSYNDFLKQVESKIVEADSTIKKLKLKELFTELENELANQISLGSNSIFKDAAGIFQSAISDLAGFGEEALTLEDSLRTNKDSIDDLTKQQSELSKALIKSYDDFKLVSASLIKTEGSLTNLATASTEAAKALNKIAQSGKEKEQSVDLTDTLSDSTSDLKNNTRVIEVKPFINPFTEKLAQLTKEHSTTSKALEVVNKNASWSDLFSGKAYDPSRFQGGIPGVTPENNDALNHEKFKLVHDSVASIVSEYKTTKKQETELNNAIAKGALFQNSTPASALKAAEGISELELKQTEIVDLQKKGLNNSITGWFRDFSDDLATNLKSLDDKSRETKYNFDNLKDSVSGFGNQFDINKVDAVTKGLRDVDKAYESQVKSIEDFERSLKRDLAIDDNASIDNLSAEQISNLVKDNIDLTPILNAALANAPVGSKESQDVKTITDQYLAGLISNKDALIAVLAQVDEVKSKLEQDKDKAVLRQTLVGNQEIESEAQRDFGDRASALSQVKLDQPFLPESFKKKIQLEDDLRKAQSDRADKLREIALLEFDGADDNDIALRRIEAEQIYQQEIENSKKKASEFYDFLQTLNSGGETAVASFIEGIGTSLFNQGEKEKEQLKQKAEYGEKLQAIAEKYRNDPNKQEEEIAKLAKQQKDRLKDISSEYNVFKNIVDVGKQALSSFAKELAATAAKIAAVKIVSGIAGAIGNFANGGEIQNFSSGGSVVGFMSALDLAMQKEGSGAVPIVASVGEQILSTQNQDAQFYRALKRNGEWDVLKSRKIDNFSSGGIVGSNGTVLATVSRANNKPSNQVTNINQNFNISTPDVGGFRKSQNQLMAAAAMGQQRASERNN